ncbi:MAG: PEP-CTERM sorting domain-containing protein [Armatimonadota bacterium]|nr:PEP-CTERM sorting domain-containing protein [Armatimonadota bacterium]
MRRWSLLWSILLAVLCSSVWAVPLNSFNELRNGDFETGDLTYWQHGEDIAVARDGAAHGYGAYCKRSGGDLWLRQIVDDSRSPDWDWNLHSKILDLVADITWQGWEPSNSAVSFRLDWWDERYNSVSNWEQLPHAIGAPPAGSDPAAGYYTTDWVTIRLAGTRPGEWITVNPFDRTQLPVQPRWVSVEITYTQAPGETVWVDNVILTGKCVPEPSSMIGLVGLCSTLVAGFRIRRK